MDRIYRNKIRLGTGSCDFTGRWKPSAIMDAMQEAAGEHGTGLGFGRKALGEKGIVWVITRMEVVIDRYPVYGDEVELETFPTAPRRWFFPRYYVFRDAQGQVIGKASTLWALMDWESRKMVPPDGVKDLMPDNSDLPLPLGVPAPVAEVDAEAVSSVYEPCYADLDVNGHVNNTRYMDMCCNALGIDTMRMHSISRFMINYGKEIRPEQPVTTELRVRDGSFSFKGHAGDNPFFEVGGTLSE